MMKCIMCEDEAMYKDKKPMNKRGREHNLYYCKGHANSGVAFGWLESDELEKL